MELALEPPTVASADDTGLILEVVDVGITEPAITGHPYLRLADGTVYRVPTPLTDWAITFIAASRRPGQELLPARMEFGVVDGEMYVEVLESGTATPS
ncbi:hypothetical protein [Nocardia blacklockiae]|uniref:hypothetical protein n=1 Tax=Nocardia blacklockiae TaxID=480036 RepID=UPI001894A3D6|nr:hypothetical protein [Nocardia blacklockiae]MBF6171009.1 hypothetical protein [Nocardia blacklockiae]